MKTVTPEKNRKPRRYRRHPGISFAAMAEQLGCSAQHLHLVVRKRRTSHRLMARYHALMQEASR